MSDETPKQQWIQLRMGDPLLGGVTVHPEDGDLFSLTKRMIARSARVAYRIEAFEDQLGALKRDLETWLNQQTGAVAEAFLVLKGDHFLFLVVQKEKAHDPVLEDALTDLDIRVAQNTDYDMINLSVLALPAFAEEAIRSFLPHRAGPKGKRGDAEREVPLVTGQP